MQARAGRSVAAGNRKCDFLAPPQSTILLHLLRWESRSPLVNVELPSGQFPVELCDIGSRHYSVTVVQTEYVNRFTWRGRGSYQS